MQRTKKNKCRALTLVNDKNQKKTILQLNYKFKKFIITKNEKQLIEGKYEMDIICSLN